MNATGIAGDLDKLTVESACDGALLWVELNDPPGNVLDSVMTRSLRQVAARAADLPDLRLIAFTGSGRHFSFGASVEEHRPDQVADMFREFHGLFRDLMDLDVPTAALVTGQCLGGGLELAAFCDWLIAEDTAKLGQPEIRLGVFAPVASVLLPWRCGARANALLLTGDSVDASEALACGLVDEVIPADQGRARIQHLVEARLAKLSASSLRRARRAARMELHDTFRTRLDALERLYLDDLMATRDAVEGITSFLEKRKPVWRNA